MDIAKAMYKGGKIIHANECDFFSYKNLGLLCPFCSQEVYLRKGNIRKSYFAHFHATSYRQVKKCELRASVYGNSTEISNLVEDRGQRLKIFRKHFLRMIYSEEEQIRVNLRFNNWLDSFNKTDIKVFTLDCVEYFLKHRQAMEDKYVAQLKEIKSEQILIQQQIALEAMSYLCVTSNRNLLDYLLNYSMYKLYNEQQFKLLMQENFIKNIAKICHFTAKIIIKNSYVKAFAPVTDINCNSQTEVISVASLITLISQIPPIGKKTEFITPEGNTINKVPITVVKPINIDLREKRNAQMPKMSTGNKLSTKLQDKIDTSHISKPLVIPTTPYAGSIQILQTGNIIFKQLTPRGYTDLVLGKVTAYYYQEEKLVFNWKYYENSKKYECDELNRAIDKHMGIGIDRKETLRIVASNNQQSKLSKNAKKKLARAAVR